MTPEDRKRIAEYCGWLWNTHFPEWNRKDEYGVYQKVNFDSNDAAEAVRALAEKGDWHGFCEYVYLEFCKSKITKNGIMPYYGSDVVAYLFNPENFFSLLAVWLKGKECTQ